MSPKADSRITSILDPAAAPGIGGRGKVSPRISATFLGRLDTLEDGGHVRRAPNNGTRRAGRLPAERGFATAGHMHLTVKGKQLDVGDALRAYVAEQLNTIAGKYFSNPIEATVVFAHDASYLYKADISVHVGRGMLLQSSADATEIYPAFDAACEKVAKRLRRYKRRLRDHHNASERETTEAANNAVLSARESVIHADGWADTPSGQVEEEAEGTEPVVIAEMKTTIESMSVAEAVMRMDLAELPALLFRNGAHGELNMIYRRADGNVGWVDPTSNKGSAA